MALRPTRVAHVIAEGSDQRVDPVTVRTWCPYDDSVTHESGPGTPPVRRRRRARRPPGVSAVAKRSTSSVSSSPKRLQRAGEDIRPAAPREPRERMLNRSARPDTASGATSSMARGSRSTRLRTRRDRPGLRVIRQIGPGVSGPDEQQLGGRLQVERGHRPDPFAPQPAGRAEVTTNVQCRRRPPRRVVPDLRCRHEAVEDTKARALRRRAPARPARTGLRGTGGQASTSRPRTSSGSVTPDRARARPRRDTSPASGPRAPSRAGSSRCPTARPACARGQRRARSRGGAAGSHGPRRVGGALEGGSQAAMDRGAGASDSSWRSTCRWRDCTRAPGATPRSLRRLGEVAEHAQGLYLRTGAVEGEDEAGRTSSS